MTTRIGTIVRTRPARARARRGSVYIMALMVLSITAAMAVCFASQTGLNLAQSDNHSWMLRARLASESGLDFVLYNLKTVRLRESADATSLASALHQALTGKPSFAGNYAGQTIALNGATVTLPAIAGGGGTFGATLEAQSATQIRLTVTGLAGQVTRHVRMTLAILPRRSGAFDYGLACRGPLSFFGNARLIGIGDASEANVFSAASAAASAISVSGNVDLSGDLNVVGTNSISITGTPTIGNTSDPSEWADHCHFGVTPPDFPEYDTAPLAALATTTIDSTTDLSGITTLSNVRIKAGTNPVFSSKIALNGIVYIEAPNNVKFGGQAVVKGMIVTQEAQPSQLSQCQISFTGGVEAYGIEALPADDPQYAQVRQQKGTFILAPGFGVTFGGQVSAMNGTIAADQLTFTGTAEGTVKGSIIGLGTNLTSMGGTVDFYIDRRTAEPNPAGFVQMYALIADPSSYCEVTRP